MVGTGAGYLVGLSLGLPIGYKFESTDPGAVLPGTLLSVTIEL